MPKMLLRKIIPIFKFKFENGATEFTYKGNFDKAEYEISLKHYGYVSRAYLNGNEKFKSNYEKILKKLDESTSKSNYYSIQKSIFSFPIAEYFLIIDVKQEETPGLEEIKSTSQIETITRCVIEALHLHCSNGLYYEQTYHYRFPIEKYQLKSIILNPAPFHVRWVLHEEDSILKQEEIDDCRATISLLLKKIYNKSPLNNIIYLGYSYHRTSFKLEIKSHKFLILMIIFEAFFKKESEKNASRAAKRISKLISEVQSDQMRIHKDFFDSTPDCFCKIRNQISHGDLDLDSNAIELKYPLLYDYLTKAIIRIIGIPAGSIDPKKDYYDEIEKYINLFFNALPPS